MYRTLRAFSLNDAKSVRRDSLLVSLLLIPWFLALFLRLLVPEVTTWLGRAYGFDLEPYYPLVAAFFLYLNIPLLFGVMTGFLMLDERDDDTLSALQMTPASLGGFVTYRLLLGYVLSCLLILIAAPLSGLVRWDALLLSLPAALLASLFAPFTAMLLSAFASNKVEGFAIMKGFGLLLLGPLVAYFVGARYEWLFGLLPTYYPAKVLWEGLEGRPYGLPLLLGTLYNALLTAWLTRRFRTQVYR